MSNTQAMCTSFKSEILSGIHALGTTVTRGATTADSFYGALYLTTASLGAGTTGYGGTFGSVADTGEVSGTGYTPGGVAVTNATAPTTNSTSGVWTPSASIVYSTVTLATAFNAMLLFNHTQSNKAVAVYTFGSTTVNAGNFTLTMPSNVKGSALVEIA